MRLSVLPRISSRRTLAILLVVGTGCSNPSQSPSPMNHLVRVTPIATGGACEHGGVSIASGVDVDRSGTLDDAEIEETSTVCEGIVGDLLLTTTDLATGSTECPLGGVRIESGRDSGAGGGVAENGVLETGEVETSAVVCEGATASDYDLTRPSGAVGTSRVSVAGASSSTINVPGGSGGTIRLGSDAETGPSPSSYAVFDTGSVDTTHTVPALVADLGSNGETITSDRTITDVPDGGAVNGAVYVAVDVSPARLVRYVEATNTFSLVTGLRVNEGVTLTFDVNDGDVLLAIPRDVHVRGTITTALVAASNARPSLTLRARDILVAATGSFAFGAAPGNDEGTAGGVHLEASGTLVNRGTIITAGNAHGTFGSDGATVRLVAAQVYNVGAITTTGGSATDAGQGGNVTLAGELALVNEGTITANGGEGNGGATGGYVTLALEALIPFTLGRTLVNTGAISATGGACTSQPAGAGGQLSMIATNARLRHSATIDVSGGTPANGSACAGASGGTIEVIARTEGASWDATSLVDVAGDLLAKGTPGTAASSGDGGTITIAALRPAGALARLFGYAGLDAQGGNSSTSGGSGGSVTHFTSLSGNEARFVEPEQVHIHPPIAAHGGSGTGAGDGGDVSFRYLTGTASVLEGSDDPALRLVGGIDLHAGSGMGGGYGGQFAFQGEGDVVVSGPIDVSGGGGLSGADSGTVTMKTTGEVTLSGALTGNGGNGAFQPGNGGALEVRGEHVTVSGAMSFHGGNASAPFAAPGDGGEIVVFSTALASTVIGTMDVAGGTGGTGLALPGTIVIDGVGR